VRRSIQELYDLTGKVAIVTGGAGKGFGAQIVEALLEAGATVVLTSRSLEKARCRAAELQSRFPAAQGEELDLCREESSLNLVHRLLKQHGQVDLLFNNAVQNHLSPTSSVKKEDWDRVLEVNISGTMLLSRAAAEPMRRQGKGVIVNLSSQYGLVAPDPRIYGTSGLNSPLVYGATKAALLQMTRHLAVEWAPVIRVNSLTAGGLSAGQSEEFVTNYRYRTPLGRMAGEDDLKGAAVFLASDASEWMTGQNLVIDGGWTAW
jgi:NAD(P)-dependent dehydrogenase (short-subunit alcohol dehydrogenase family)